ncbi:MAG TPA: T9SS type A sorting domain-containing protein [Bacteroidetes bacterium]|nr:T9SS type A sorting domain-containing protein [Bacteroidota bacterium]
MRLFYTACLLLLTAPLVFSQRMEFGPVQGNPVLRSWSAQNELQKENWLETTFGIGPLSAGSLRDGLNGCPPDLPPNLIVVEAGRSIDVDVDTFGLAVSGAPPQVTLQTNPPLLYGSAVYNDTTNTLHYQADPGLNGIATDTVVLHYTQGNVVDTFLKIAIDIRRKDKTVVADAMEVAPGEIVQYCLNDELDFPFERKCFQKADCFDNYDGNGYAFYYFLSDTCLIYLASRFPGVDTVCVEICDGIGICDIFKIPFRIQGDTLSIVDEPFFEDFSTANGPYPPAERWLEDDVFVNNTFSKNPPSVGMATFDGLNSGGQPYELPGGGFGDQLTSKPIDLSGFQPNDNVYLRFFLSPKGFGQEPEEDDFIVEFRNKQRQWEEVLIVPGTGDLPFDSIPPFEFYAVKIEEPAFFHNAFQMRFRAASSPGGYGDWWHLDYIHLSANSTEVNNFSDFAFATVPQTFLKNYTAIPLRHLQADPDGEIKKSPDDSYSVTLSNRSNSGMLGFSTSEILFSETTNAIPLGSPFVVASGNEPVTDPLSHNKINILIPPANRDELIADIETLTGNDPKIIHTAFSFVGNVAEDQEFKTNNNVVLNTPLSDFFAHDDGSAELQFFWSGAQGGEEAAVRYKANVGDSLRGVRIMFPHFSFYDIESQFFNLKIWFGDENGPMGDPVYEQELLRPFFPDTKWDTLQGFTSYRLEDVFENPTPLYIPAGTWFYVGYEQVSAAQRGIPIGYDLDNPCGCNFRKKTDSWIPFTSNDPAGAMMIRPVFGGIANTTSATTEKETSNNLLRLFPNPASGILNVNLKDGTSVGFSYKIFNQLGQMLQSGNLQTEISLSGLPPGHYYLQILSEKTGETRIGKFLVNR